MRRIALISSVLLPLPFAALPLAAVVFSGGAPTTGTDLGVTSIAPSPRADEAVNLAAGTVDPASPCGDAANVT